MWTGDAKAMTDTDPIAEALRIQGRVCASMGAPFSEALLTRAAEDVRAEGPTRDLMGPWAGATLEAHFKLATPLRWLGALHDLALSGDDPALTNAYPGPDRPGDETAAWDAARRAMRRDAPRLVAFMDHEPQTNEVRRSVCLIGGFLTIAQATGLPLRVFELGASAGLNHLFDRYYYEFGAAGAWGAAEAKVRLDTDWRGGPPPLGAPMRVVERAACDRKPVPLTDAASRRRLKAYVWADQRDRFIRLDAAIAEAVAMDTQVEAQDAVDFTLSRVAPREGTASVLFHSVFWQYMPADKQAALDAAITGIGARATASAPFAWLRMEPSERSLAEMEVLLTLWPEGETRRLARCHSHGAWVEWDA